MNYVVTDYVPKAVAGVARWGVLGGSVLAAVAEGCGWLAICITGAATFNRRRRARERLAGQPVEPQDI